MEGTYKFKAEAVLNECVDWIKGQGEKANFNKVVLGISGGKDSTIAAALCCRAFGSENVHGLLLPNGEQKDINDAINVCDVLGIKYDTVNIKPIYDGFVLSYNMFVSNSKSNKLSEEALINLAPRIRMTMIRLWGQNNKHRMCGTGNYSEITVGYCTKDGDTCFDFNPLGRLTSVEVVQLGLLMKELPKKLVLKTPDDGLSGKTDEEKLGVSYENIHKYIRGIKIEGEIWNKIHDLESAGMHKRLAGAPIYNPSEKLICTVQAQS